MSTIAEMLVRMGMDTSSFKQGAGQVKSELSNLESSFNGLEKAGKRISSIGNAMTIGITAPLVAAGAALGNFTTDAAGMVKVRDAFNGVAESAGYSGDEMLAAMKKGSQGMISNIDLMKNFNLAANLVSKDFATKLPDAFGYLGKVSAATGESMDYMLNSLIKGVGRLSPLILDNLGIQVDMNVAYEEYAKTLGKSTDELTKAEQQTAIMNKTMELLADNTAAMPENFGSVTASLKATFQNAKDAIGETLIPVLASVTQSLSDAIEKIVAMTTEGGNLYPVIQSLGEGFADAVEDISNFITKLSEIDPVWVRTIANILLFLAALGPIMSVGGKVVSAIGAIGNGLLYMGTAMTGSAVAGAAMVGPLALVAAAVIAGGVAIAKHKAGVDVYAQSLEDSRAAAVAAGQTYEQYAEQVGNVGNTVDDANFDLTMHQGSLKDVKKALLQLGEQGIITNSELNQYYNGVKMGNITVEEAQAAVYRFMERQRDLGYAVDQTAEDMIAQSISAAQLANDLQLPELALAATAEEAQIMAENIAALNAVTSIGGNFQNMVTYATQYDTVQKQITEKTKELTTLLTDVNGDGIVDIADAAGNTSTKVQGLVGEIESLQGALEAMAAQATLNMLQATIAIGGITDAEAKLFFDTAVAMGQMTQKGADAAYKAYSDSIKLMNLLELDPKTGEITVEDYDAMMAILALDNMTIAEKIAAIEALLSGEEEVKSTLDGLSKGRVATITVNAVVGRGAELLPRAEGGPVVRDKLYMVGEKGPELFIPNVSGEIIPNHKLPDYANRLGSSGAGLGTSVTNNYNLTMPTTADAGDVKMAFELMEAWGT